MHSVAPAKGRDWQRLAGDKLFRFQWCKYLKGPIVQLIRGVIHVGSKRTGLTLTEVWALDTQVDTSRDDDEWWWQWCCCLFAEYQSTTNDLHFFFNIAKNTLWIILHNLFFCSLDYCNSLDTLYSHHNCCSSCTGF